jgi:hypothetical protein
MRVRCCQFLHNWAVLNVRFIVVAWVTKIKKVPLRSWLEVCFECHPLLI